MIRRVAAAAGVLLASIALPLSAWIAVHGRFDLWTSSRHFAIRRVTPVSLIAWMAIVMVFSMLPYDRRTASVAGAAIFLRKHARSLAAAVAIVVFVVCARLGAVTAAGSDPYGYVTQAWLWAKGGPVQSLPVLAFGAPVDPFVFCPLGYRPGAIAGTMVPTYSAGYPLVMASFARIAGPGTVFLIVPLAAGAIVWLTFLIARDLMSPGAALIAVACTAASPVFLFESMQPMSDIPLTAWVLGAIAFVRRRTFSSALAAGAAASMAIVTRPNVAPLALAAGLLALAGRGEDWRRQLARLGLFVAASLPGMALVAAINAVLYGSPLSSGYGSLGSIYQSSGAWRTAWQYVVWLWDTHSIFIFVALACPLLAIVRPGDLSPRLRAFWRPSLAIVAVNFGCYVFYTRFDHWSFLRFLLPSIPVLFILAAAAADALLSGASIRVRAAAMLLILLIFPFAYVHSATRGEAFVLRAGFRHAYEEAAEFAKTTLPPNAVFLALTETGALRLYGGRPSLRFELIDPTKYYVLVDYLHRQRLLPYAALERHEVSEFETRFELAWTTASGAAKTIGLPPDDAVVFVPLDATSR